MPLKAELREWITKGNTRIKCTQMHAYACSSTRLCKNCTCVLHVRRPLIFYLYYISGPIWPITLIWASLERSFPPADVEYRWCQFWSKVMTSDVEERPRLVMASYKWHRSQWVMKMNLNFLEMFLQSQYYSSNFFNWESFVWCVIEDSSYLHFSTISLHPHRNSS